ncbi:MAG: SPOR domain-containing protein [Candidatus Thiodiazotropha sp. (ex Ctena orbiculata)]|uniref:SPOR domain-containing protein n=1 Tax=Candidatus Thiodiazotropha taylori TaxID=2792791 RepID=A0A944MFM0_9GAMM|nr:SPOR domain-containing protein [Candidatus Thiodiazotropha taylori]PUB85544.1 MAG: cell division protein [gamma proteobacterium symbiont of Ctena orbiculata]MBT2990968.1 SPOR domain-containing protein [Candidatus Thiodiazotropha taylori]MBT2998651.1 SPOR domain-containing protein [Candidatus Thiodiazotropha taylori]MBT3002765.1 SPOR domain-containing protein [Candidatus Thiodiazotropha taylori]
MADYKHRAHKKKKQRQNSGSCLFHLFGGLVAGAFLMGVIWLKLGPGLSTNKVPGIPTPRSESAEQQQSVATRPTFEFYTILPEMEVVIPDEEIVTPARDNEEKIKQPTDTAAIRKQESYVLQMGSFRKHQDADRLKAKLALIGIEAEIQKVSINNRDTYHRVRSGPYHSQSQINAVRRLAKENNINSLVIKLKR